MSARYVIGLLAGLRGGVDEAYIVELAQTLKLNLDRKFEDLSHGNKQKVAIIQAFMHRPDLLILDEPTLGLDPLVQREFRQLLLQANARGATVLLSSHVLSEVESMCTRIGVIKEGRLVRKGTLEELRTLKTRHVDIVFDSAPVEYTLRSIAGVQAVEVQGCRATLQVHGSMRPLLTALAWVVGGTLANYVMVLGLARELEEFPGGSEMLARVLGPSIEAFRPLRWPAERLDTLGGYATYHNVILITMFLSVYAIVLGAKSLRNLESRGSLDLLLGTGVSRTRILVARSIGFAALLAVIAASIAAGTAIALSVVGEPDTSGAFVTLLASWCAAVMCYSCGLLLSQFVATGRAAAGIGATALIVLYVAGNSAENLGPFGFVEIFSPFTYTNHSRALVPGVSPHWPSMAGMLAIGALALATSAWCFERRDIGSTLGRRPARSSSHARARRTRTVSSLWGDALLHGWVSIAIWAVSAALLTGIMVSLEPAAMTAWEYFDVLLPAASGTETEREAQYLAFSASIMIPLIAGYVVAQSAKWSADFTSGRVGVLLAAPVTWAKLLTVRFTMTTVGTGIIFAASALALWLVAGTLGIDVEPGGIWRMFVISLALGLAMTALSSITTIVVRHRNGVLVLAVYLATAYLLTFLVPMFDWPEWMNRISVFYAFGNPYLEWPTLAQSTAILTLAGPGLILAYFLAARSPKAP